MLDFAPFGRGDAPSGEEIDRFLLDRSDLIDQSPVRRIVAAHLASGGDRVRARLAHETCRRAGHRHASAVAVAACVEGLHQASLIHDDLTDRSAERRGRPAVWRAHGDAVALAVGDHLISLSYACLADAADVDARRGMTFVHQAVSSTIRGQCAEWAAAEKAAPSTGIGVFADWSGIAALKTGPLLALGPELAFASRQDGEASAAMRVACRRLGLGYQAIDDCRDVAEDRASRGGASNLCLRLEAARLTPAEAMETALFHAERELRAALREAARIPGGLGEPLARLCLTKLREMEARFDAI